MFTHPRYEYADDHNGRPWFRLADPLTFSCCMGAGQLSVTVPVNFETDFASVPRFLHRWFPPRDRRCRRPAVLHDFLYSRSGGCSRFLADALFREAMIQEGVPTWKATLMYYAVRLFARRHWRKR